MLVGISARDVTQRSRKVSSYFECAAAGQIPGDCGEGIHFTAVANSTITHDVVANNSGGVLLSDDTGPTHGNLVAGNYVTDNFTDGGITVPGTTPLPSTRRAGRSRGSRASTTTSSRTTW